MNNRLRNFLVLFLFVLTCGYAQAQTTVKGVISSKEDGTALPGVTVVLKGTTKGTTTDKDGKFSIAATGNGTLVISSVGYTKQEIAIQNRTTINVSLEGDAQMLNEVLIVGYGTVNKATHVGSSAQIGKDVIATKPVANVMNALVGAAPGVQATLSGGAPGSEPTIRVRGFGSLSASNNALYVVDGVPFNGSTSTLNPDDIESISVLKDAATTAIYGSRGANGVIMITTKKGKEGRNNFNVSASVGVIARGLPEYETVSAQQYYPLMWEVYRNTLAYGSLKVPQDVASSIASGLTTSYGGRTYTGIYNLLGNYNPFNVASNQIVDVNGQLNPNAQLLYPEDLNWANAMQQGGKSRKNYTINYDGGTSKSDYFVSLGYTKEQGYLLKSDFERFTGRVSVNTQATKWLKTGLNLNGTYSMANVDAGSDGGTSFINPFFISRFMAPIYPVYKHDPTTGAYVLDANGNKVYDMGDSRPNSSGRHTIWENELNQRNQIRGLIGARTFATISILPSLKATTNLSFDLQDTHYRTYDNPTIGDGAPAGRSYHYLYRTTNYTWNQLLEYDKQIGKHHVTVLGGHENFTYKYNYLTGSRSGIIVDGITELPNFATVLGVSSYEDNYTIESYFARANYDFDKKYILNASIRRDGNSRFAPAVRWANFWSVGGAYNIEREDFFDVKWVDLLKVRASYGVVGNDGGLGFYPYQALYTLGRNNNAEPGFSQASIPNPDLTWETANNFDLGVDFSLFKGKLSGSLEYFNRETAGLIFNVPLPLASGGTTGGGFTIPKNIGNLYNRGLELQLTGDIINTGDFKYSATINATTLKNQITKMPENQPLIINGSKAYSVGHSIYDFYLRQFYGVDSETGNALYKTNILTTNGKVIGADTVTTVLAEANQRYNGTSSIPDVYGSMNNNFSYKNFTLSVQLTYQLGGKVYDSAYGSLMHGGTYGNALHVDALRRWQKPGDVTDVPRFDNGNITNQTGGSTRYLTDASYLMLNNVTLTYKIPSNWLAKIGAKNASIYFSGENLGLLSARKGMNVTGSFNGTVDNTYNFNRVMSIGARLGF
ncbi:SusC/RagA family TonB-linked outer membrane protein [Cellulophaga sp. BC115SP]|uniref:SusC/RagA family TonB-linked outer membrane protein n=1 Tax=Cellulophaga sp. BC115SP TaxID=2683263 RepID=UPI001412EC78|nr:SusC/RagA family TonB-linked outer membrane protein [Cellulophaga sp. BC115SP]NBB28958.1 SusC/RagA family TonB-linked outer membrane protein [Cellulophaga sp. BC115SP]